VNRELDDESWSDLAEVDPQDCEACVAAGDLCAFHTGFAEGWDACAGLVARMVTGDV
jgi:hypothetical protein